VKKYEAMIIFREDLKDTDWDGAVEAVRAEIEKLGGKMTSSTRLGKREFARPMQKQQSGHYGLIAFQLEGDKVAALQARLKLDEQVFRVQVVSAPVVVPAPRKEVADGVAQ
jgi:ribosomal protein S6